MLVLAAAPLVSVVVGIQVARRADAREAREREEQQQAACKDRIRSQIDNINSQMRAGYSASQGTRLRERRRDLEQQLREC